MDRGWAYLSTYSVSGAFTGYPALLRVGVRESASNAQATMQYSPVDAFTRSVLFGSVFRAFAWVVQLGSRGPEWFAVGASTNHRVEPVEGAVEAGEHTSGIAAGSPLALVRWASQRDAPNGTVVLVVRSFTSPHSISTWATFPLRTTSETADNQHHGGAALQPSPCPSRNSDLVGPDWPNTTTASYTAESCPAFLSVSSSVLGTNSSSLWSPSFVKPKSGTGMASAAPHNNDKDTINVQLGEDGIEFESLENSLKSPSEPARPSPTPSADCLLTHDDTNAPSSPSSPPSSASSPPSPRTQALALPITCPQLITDSVAVIVGELKWVETENPLVLVDNIGFFDHQLHGRPRRAHPRALYLHHQHLRYHTRAAPRPHGGARGLRPRLRREGRITNRYLGLQAKEASGLAAVDVEVTLDTIHAPTKYYSRDGVIKTLKKYIEKTALKLVQDLREEKLPEFDCHVTLKPLVWIGVVNAIIVININDIHLTYSIYDHDCSLAPAQRQHSLASSSSSLTTAAASDGNPITTTTSTIKTTTSTITTTTSTGTSSLMRPSLASPFSPTLLVHSMSFTKRFAGRGPAPALVCGFLSSITTDLNSSNHVVSWKSKLTIQNHIRPPQARFLPRPSPLILPRQMNLPTGPMASVNGSGKKKKLFGRLWRHRLLVSDLQAERPGCGDRIYGSKRGGRGEDVGLSGTAGPPWCLNSQFSKPISCPLFIRMILRTIDGLGSLHVKVGVPSLFSPDFGVSTAHFAFASLRLLCATSSWST
ncbi:hypothetical protein GALMADRAFT_145297 [Galerina marginata CBS 339.88]|uniref:Uncharacterized protein n=1 Tax=Galerina marginata (strain CBS 339.88) TaxID=685588 RepID=A0A067SF72_GALM3|nr:hypothetical protein GALMADRAFT_145297 [Galerina marginata CBS 339.88]